MWTLLERLWGGGGDAAQASSPMWTAFWWIAGILVLLGLFRLLFIFSPGQSCIGFMLFGGKIVRENMEPKYYPQIPFVYYGESVYLGLKTLPFAEETRSLDQMLVVVKGALHFRVLAEHATKYRFGVEDADKIILERALSAMRSAVSSKPAKESFEHKDAIATSVIESIKDGLQRDVGVEVIEVPITEVAPHKEVAAAFNAVQAAQRKVDETLALADVKRTEAQGDADAMKIRAGGQASQLEQQANGLLDMLSTLTGNPLIDLPADAAVFVMLHFLGLQMRTAFATGGKSTAMVIPDDREITLEAVRLLPSLVAHSAVDEAGTEDRTEAMLKALETKTAKSDEGTQAAVKELTAKARSGIDGITDEFIEKMPKMLRPMAKRLREDARRRKTFGGGVKQ